MPDHVDVPVGVQDTSRTGRIFSVIGAAMFLGIFFLGWYVIAGNRDDVRLHFQSESVSEVSRGADFGCEWQIDVRVVNRTDAAIELDRSYVILDRSRTSARLIRGTGRIVADANPGWLFAVTVPPTSAGSCPSVDSLDHGDLYLEFGSAAQAGTIDRSLRF